MAETNDKQSSKGGTGCGVGCLSLLGPGLLLGGLYYWFGHPLCIDAPCNDTMTTGPAIAAIGAVFTFLLVWVLRRNKNK
jgi:hypothetical protein